MTDTYTSTNCESTQNVDIDSMVKFSRTMKNDLYDTFMGIAVVIDDELTGMSWHIAMSREMFQELEKRRIETVGV